VTPTFDWLNPDYESVYLERATRLARIRADGFDLAALKAHYAEHPADFVSDWGMTFDPRAPERGLPSTMPFVLFPRQQEYIRWLVERWRGREDGLVEKSRDVGASYLCVAFAVWMWLFKPGTVVGFGSRKEMFVDASGNPSSIFWKIREFVELLPVEFKPTGYSRDKHAAHMRMTNPENGSSIIGEAGEQIGRGARASLYFVDESAFLPNQEMVDAALSQTANCKIHVSTPNGSGNVFYRKRHGGRVSCFIFDWKDDPRKDKAWYQRMKDTLDPVVVAAEIDRDYTASVSDAWIPGAMVTAAQSLGPADLRAVGPLMYGLDVARFGDDKCVLTRRQGRVVYPQIIWGKCDLEDTVGRTVEEIRSWADQPDQIAVDSIGVGAGAADMLRRIFGDIVVDVNSAIRVSDGQNYNLRAKIWREMRAWIKGGASLPADPELTTDLTALRYKYTGGLLQIESKDDAKKRGMKSPDRADSLALTFAYPAKAPGDGDIPQSPVWQALDDSTGY
jgi:phage terminase large subunit